MIVRISQSRQELRFKADRAVRKPASNEYSELSRTSILLRLGRASDGYSPDQPEIKRFRSMKNCSGRLLVKIRVCQSRTKLHCLPSTCASLCRFGFCGDVRKHPALPVSSRFAPRRDMPLPKSRAEASSGRWKNLCGKGFRGIAVVGPQCSEIQNIGKFLISFVKNNEAYGQHDGKHTDEIGPQGADRSVAGKRKCRP